MISEKSIPVLTYIDLCDILPEVGTERKSGLKSDTELMSEPDTEMLSE